MTHRIPQSQSTADKTSVPNSTENGAEQTDDQARQDGGKTTENEYVSKAQMEMIEEKAKDHTKDEPGS
ncbi:MAG: hypothetical protein U0795_00505 [Pirellulales bacterium]